MSDTPHPDKLDLLIQQMRELRAELREFMKDEKPAEVREWKIGDRVRITKKETHCFINGQVVELIEHRKNNVLMFNLVQTSLKGWTDTGV